MKTTDVAHKHEFVLIKMLFVISVLTDSIYCTSLLYAIIMFEAHCIGL